MFPFPTGQARSDQQQYDRTGDRGNQAAERADGNESEQTEKPTAQNAADNTDDQVQPESRSVAF